MPSAGRTSMPTSLPVAPESFIVLVTVFAEISTIAMASSPTRAATLWACAAPASAVEARRAAARVVIFMAGPPSGPSRLRGGAVHDAFLQVWQRAASFDPSRGDARAWLYAVLRHRALNI